MRSALVVTLVAALAGCGGGNKKTAVPTTGGMRSLDFSADDGSVPVPNSCETPLEGAALTRDVVRCNILQLRARVNTCYQQELQLDGTLEGTLTVAFTITGSGTVMAPSAQGIGDARLRDCVTAVFAKASFPPSGDSIRVTYPFAFAPGR